MGGCVPNAKKQTAQKNVLPFLKDNEKMIEAFKKLRNPFAGIPEEKNYEWNENDPQSELNNQVIYIGKRQNDNFQGKVVLFHKSTKNLLIAIYDNNKIKNQFCRKILNNGDMFLGEVDRNYKFHGQDEEYKGNFEENKYSGEGVLKRKNGWKFIGTFNDGEMEEGTLETQQTVYKGRFLNNKKHDDNGKITWKNGGYYIGQFQEDEMHGKGKLYNNERKLVRNVHWICGQMINS